MKSTYWIKLYQDILRDPKMGRLPDRVWRRCIELFLLAGQEHRGGRLPTVPDMAWQLRIEEEDLIEDLHELRRVGIVDVEDGNGWVVVNFAKRQAPATDAERMRRYRKRKQKDKKETVTKRNDDVTNNRYETVTNTVTHTDTDTDTDTEKKQIRARAREAASASVDLGKLKWDRGDRDAYEGDVRHFLTEYDPSTTDQLAKRLGYSTTGIYTYLAEHIREYGWVPVVAALTIASGEAKGGKPGRKFYQAVLKRITTGKAKTTTNGHPVGVSKGERLTADQIAEQLNRERYANG